MIIRLETERLVIRNIGDRDLGPLLKIYTDSKNMKYISNGRYDWTRDQLFEKYQGHNQNYKNGFGIFAVELKDSEEVIGEAGFFNSFDDLTALELGYIIDSKFWSNGYGYEICKALIKYGFDVLKLKKIVSRMYAENFASVRISEKCGMKKVDNGFAKNSKEYLVYNITREVFAQKMDTHK